MTATTFRGKRIQFAGSADQDCDPDILENAHNFIRYLTKQLLETGIGLVVQVGDEPKDAKNEKSVIFDWTILETVDECLKVKNQWPKSQGAQIVIVGFSKALKKIPKNRKEMWDHILDSECTELKLLKNEISIGGTLREKQASYGDVLITLGGSVGVHHLSEIYIENKKTVIPLNLPIKKEENNASISLFRKVCEKPTEYIQYSNPELLLSAFITLDLSKPIDFDKYWAKFYKFLNNIAPPHAFYVRLQNKEIESHEQVEWFFRNIVDKIIVDMGYNKYELGISKSEDIFMNVELFNKLHYSSLVIVDMTAVRPNCCIELGYVLGLRKKIIITAMEKTKLPWDVKSIRCYYWDPKNDVKKEIIKLSEFMETNIIRGPLVKNHIID